MGGGEGVEERARFGSACIVIPYSYPQPYSIHIFHSIHISHSIHGCSQNQCE